MNEYRGHTTNLSHSYHVTWENYKPTHSFLTNNLKNIATSQHVKYEERPKYTEQNIRIRISQHINVTQSHTISTIARKHIAGNETTCLEFALLYNPYKGMKRSQRKLC